MFIDDTFLARKCISFEAYVYGMILVYCMWKIRQGFNSQTEKDIYGKKYFR